MDDLPVFDFFTKSNRFAMQPIQIDLSTLDQTAEFFLIWIGFGTLVGLVAKAIMPGHDPGGALMTLFLGILGTFFGCAMTAYLQGLDAEITPVSTYGFAAGVTGAFVLLFSYRMLGGYMFVEGEDRVLRTRRRRRRRYIYDE